MPTSSRTIACSVALATTAALVCAACKSKSFDRSADHERAVTDVAKVDHEARSAAGSGTAVAPATPQSAQALADQVANDGRKIIRTGHIELVVGSYDEARAQLDALVTASGGYVDSTEVVRRQNAVSDATIVVRVPANAFGGLVPKLRDLGEVRSETTNANDVTDQYVDFTARMTSARTLEKRLLELASDRTGTIDQVLSVERELARVRGDIEGYEGHLRQWDDQLAMSTLTLSLMTKRPEIATAPEHEPSLGARTSHALTSSLSALHDVCAWVIVNGIAFLPWLLVLVPGAMLGARLTRRMRTRLPRARAVQDEA